MRLMDLVRQIQETILVDPKVGGYKLTELNEFLDEMEHVNSVKLKVNDETREVSIEMEH